MVKSFHCGGCPIVGENNIGATKQIFEMIFVLSNCWFFSFASSALNNLYLIIVINSFLLFSLKHSHSSSNYYDITIYLFLNLKENSYNLPLLFAISFKSEEERQLFMLHSWKIDNYLKSNREKNPSTKEISKEINIAVLNKVTNWECNFFCSFLEAPIIFASSVSCPRV